MKKLFAIKNLSTGDVIKDLDFEIKEDAKKERKKRNAKDESGKEIFTHVVTLGVDHDDYVTEQQRKERENRQHESTSRNTSRRKRHQESVEAN